MLPTVAFGNVIVIFVASAKAIPRRSTEFFVIAGLMFLDMYLFFYLASRYNYFVVQNRETLPEAYHEKPVAKKENL